MNLDERIGAAVEELRRQTSVDPAGGLVRLHRTYRGRRNTRAVMLAIVLALVAAGVTLRLGGPESPEPAPPVGKVTNGQLVTWNSYDQSLTTVGEDIRLPSTAPLAYPTVAFSGDGRELLYSTEDRRVVAFDIETGNQRVLGRCDSPCLAAGVSPDTTQIALAESDGITVVSESGRHRISTPGVQPGLPVWSADGSRIAFAARQGLYVVGADGSGLQLLLASTDKSGLLLPPSWSPDGRSLAYISGRPTQGQNPDSDISKSRFTLVTVDVASGTSTRLISLGRCVCLGAPAPSVAWSPDGRLIGFTRAYGGGVLAIAAQGGEVERLATLAGGGILAWRPILD